jgi:mono/diheme cytochrome c family protein
VRSCGGCHGVNTTDQAGQLPATNMPQALKTLLDYWRVNADPLFKGTFD